MKVFAVYSVRNFER